MGFRSKRFVAGIGALVAGACVAGTVTGFVPMSADDLHARGVVATVQKVAPAAVSDVATGAATSTDAVTVAKDKGRISVPKRARDGVRFGGVTVGLPYAAQAGDATASQTGGVVVFDNKNGSSTVPVIHTDGTVQLSTVIADRSAPHTYAYPIGMTAGQRLEATPDGGAIVTDGQTVAAVIAAPWAKDANGSPVPTRYEIAGDTLTQVVDFTTTTAFPVVADPNIGHEWWGFWVKLTKAETKRAATIGDGLSYVKTIAQGICSAAGGGWTIAGCIAAIEGAWGVTGPGVYRNAANQGKCVALNFPVPYVYLINTTIQPCIR